MSVMRTAMIARLRRFLLAIAWVMPAPELSAQDGSKVPVIPSELVNAAAEYASHLHRVQAKLKLNNIIRWLEKGKPGTQENLQEFEILQSDKCLLLIMIRQNELLDPDKGTRGKMARAYCINTKYSFKLQNRNDKGWLLNTPVFHGKELKLDTGENVGDYARAWLSQQYVFPDTRLGLSFCEAEKDKTFQLSSMSRRNENGIGQITLSYSIRRRQKEGNLAVAAELTAAEENGWAMTKTTMNVDDHGDKQVGETVCVTEKRAGFWVPKLVRSKYDRTTVSGDTYSFKLETDYAVSIRDVPEIEFTLTAFGLPEPVGVSWEKPHRYHWWIAFAAALCLLAAVWIARRKSRRGQTSAPP